MLRALPATRTSFPAHPASDSPTTGGAFQTTPNGKASAFASKLNAGGTGPVYSTYLGGSSGDAVKVPPPMHSPW